jgi:MFS family permease
MPPPVEALGTRATTAPNGVIARLGAVITCHSAVDVYAAIVPPLIGVLQIRCDLTRPQAAWLLGLGSLASGLCQPFAAWLSDRFDTRLFGPIGLAIAAICLSSIGLAHNFATLVPLYMIGALAIGVFHPIGASSAGHLADHLPGGRRGLGVSLFYVAGMVGSVIGSLMASEVAVRGDAGFNMLMFAMIPGLMLAVVLRVAVGKIGHRHEHHRAMKLTAEDSAARWGAVAMLFAGNALRFIVNMALVYLLVRWAEAHVAAGDPLMGAEQIAERGGKIAATLNALLIVGMGVGGLAAGALIPRGREKWPLILAPIITAPFIALLGQGSLGVNYLLAILAGVSFSGVIPVTISVAQRLLPHRTSLASGLMMGGAWGLAVVGPRLAEWCLTSVGLSLAQCFALVAGLLVLSGFVTIPLRANLLRQTSMQTTPRA